jgi:hypothetical protein
VMNAKKRWRATCLRTANPVNWKETIRQTGNVFAFLGCFIRPVPLFLGITTALRDVQCYWVFRQILKRFALIQD